MIDKPRQFKAKHGHILDAETGEQIAVILPANCSKKLLYNLAKLAVAQFNAQELGNYRGKSGREA